MSYYVLIASRTRRQCLKPKIVDSQATAATSDCQHDVHASLSLPQSSHYIRNITSSALVAQWIARWTSNPTVAGSSPVKSECVALGWPSGLRRQTQVLLSPDAWVRIPLQA